MFKTIFASMTGESSQRSVLETSLLLARLFEGEADCVHVQLDPATLAELTRRPFATEFVLEEQIRYLDREARERAEAARKIFESVKETHTAIEGEVGKFPLKWQSVAGIDTDETIARSRPYDVVVVGRDPETYSLGKDRIGAIVMACGRPVLIVPERAPKSLDGRVVIAWKNCAEAARVVSVAHPLLMKASQVVIVHAAEGNAKAEPVPSVQKLGENLNRHGCRVETRQLANDGRSAADRIRSFSAEIDADMIVMGAYGHSRLREFIFGGVTSSILDDCAIPVLLFH